MSRGLGLRVGVVRYKWRGSNVAVGVMGQFGRVDS